MSSTPIVSEVSEDMAEALCIMHQAGAESDDGLPAFSPTAVPHHEYDFIPSNGSANYLTILEEEHGT